MVEKLRVTISKTAGSGQDYMQVLSNDSFSVNVVLIAGEIEINDTRPKARKTREPKA